MNESEKVEERQIHWADKKEVSKSGKGLKFLLFLLKFMPTFFIHLLCLPVGFFYFIFSKRAQTECLLYQNQLRDFTNGKVPKKLSSYMQILSFAQCVVERMEGWLGKYEYKDLILHDDDLQELIGLLNNEKGAVLIGSHLGSIELLRSLSCYDRTGVRRTIPVIAIMETKITQQFSNIMNRVNPNSGLNLIDPSDITPDTMIQMQEHIEKGGLVVFTADRTSANSRNRCIRESFLGKTADFPYGVFLLALLLKAPTYYMFGLRSKTYAVYPHYNMFVEKSKIDFNCGKAQREERIKEMCREFVQKLQHYCVQFPYQWYNFYYFWLLNGEGEDNEKA